MTKKRQPPLFHIQSAESLDKLHFDVHSGPIPWWDVQVFVTKRGHGHHMQTGRVTNMLLHQTTISGLRIQIMFDHLSAKTLLAQETFDYNDIVKSMYKHYSTLFGSEYWLLGIDWLCSCSHTFLYNIHSIHFNPLKATKTCICDQVQLAKNSTWTIVRCHFCHFSGCPRWSLCLGRTTREDFSSW